MFKITVTRGTGPNAVTRTGRARTAAGVTLAATNLVQIMVPLEDRTKVLPPVLVSAFATGILAAIRAGVPAFTKQIADIIVSVREHTEYSNDEHET